MNTHEQYASVCRDVAKIIASSCDDVLAKEILTIHLQKHSTGLSIEGLNQHFPYQRSGWNLAKRINHIAKTVVYPSTHDIIKFCKRLVDTPVGGLNVEHFIKEGKECGLPESESELRQLMDKIAPAAEFHSMREQGQGVINATCVSTRLSVNAHPRGIDPELVALSKSLPRNPGYVSFVREARYLPAHQRVFQEQGMVVFVRAGDGTGHREFPMLCHFRLLKRERTGWVPKWFVPAGTGIALVKVKPTEYAAIPLGEFEPGITDYDSVSVSDSVFNEALRKIYKEASERDRAMLSGTSGLFPPDKASVDGGFSFEIGDWVYAPLTLLSGPDGTGQTHQIKAQVQFTSGIGMGSDYYTIRFDICDIEVMGRSSRLPLVIELSARV